MTIEPDRELMRFCKGLDQDVSKLRKIGFVLWIFGQLCKIVSFLLAVFLAIYLYNIIF